MASRASAVSLMMKRLRVPHLLAVVAVFLAFVPVGCGGGAPEGALVGRVRIDGSSTVYPLTEAVAEEFMEEHPRVRVTVGVSGTGGGFSNFVRKVTDINDASRPIRPVEVERAEENAVEYIELPIALDGLAVIVHPQNDWVECVTVEELREIWRPDSEVESWSDVRSSFPDRPIHLYGPGTASGTYDYFTAAVVGEEGASRADFTASEDDNVLVQGVAGDPNALGYVPLAYYENNQDQLKLLGVDDSNPANGEGCIEASTETVNAGTYQPLSRPLFLYVRAERAEDPAVQAFVEFYVEQAGQLARQVGYIPLSGAGYTLVRERFEERISGSVFGGEGSQVGVRITDVLRQQQGAPVDGSAAASDTSRAAQ